MAEQPTHVQVYRAAEDEGARRLDMPPLEQLATAFIAGVTVVFGIAALGVTEALTRPLLGPEAAQVAGAVAFGTGLVLLVVGRAELFTENFFDPVAAAIARGGSAWRSLLRLWAITLVLNLVGGALLCAVLSVREALPAGATESLVGVAEEMAGKPAAATLARAVLAGALLTLLSYVLHSADSTRARITLAWLVGFLVAVGPFDHVVVNALHLLVGVWNGAAVTSGQLLAAVGLALVGNLAGGLLLMTLTHTAQVKGSRGAER